MGPMGGIGAGNMGGFYPPMGSFGGFGGQNSNLAPEERYKEQLITLNDMGFVNKEVNLEALTATGGNVEAAVERILAMIGK